MGHQQARGRIKQLTYQSMTTALLLRNLLVKDMSFQGFFQILGETLKSLGCPWSAVALLKNPMTLDGGSRTFIPDQLRLHLLQRGDRIESWSQLDAPVLRAGEDTFFLPERTAEPIMVFPLFFRNVHYGMIMAEVPQDHSLFFYTMSLELGTGLQYLYLARDYQDAQSALLDANVSLSYSANHDALTGLLNRGGFMAQYNTMLVSISLGCFPFTGDQAGDYTALMKKADELLYEAKKHRPSTVIREED